MVKHNRTTPNARESKFDLSKISARVDRVNVAGLLRTHDDYIKRAADGLFKAKNFQDLMLEAMNARSYLNELGIFKDIHVRVDVSRGTDASPDGYEVSFTGKELSRIVGSMGTELGQNEGSLRTELTVPNLFGRGESIALQGSYSSTRANDLTLKFWKSLFHTRFVENRPEFSFSLFRRMDRMDISKFQVSNLGCISEFAFNTNFPLELTHSLQYEASIRELSLLYKDAPFVVRSQCGPQLASLLRYALVYDQRDHAIFPTRGLMIKSVNEYCGLGGNVAYVSNNTHAELSVPLFSGIVAQICGRVGILGRTKQTMDLPISNCFQLGGPLTLRGFKYGSVGRSVDGASIGTEKYWCAGLHLWAPLPFNRVFKGLGNNFRTHLFYNMGNFDKFSTENMRSAAGIGIAFSLAERARIELNYCVPVHKYAGDHFVNSFQFGIGYEFV